jgi:hypothetical protein
MAKTKKNTDSPHAAAAKKTSPAAKSPASFSGSPRRKSSELKKLEAVSTRGSRRINLLKMIDCHEGVQLIYMAIPGKKDVEGFARDLIVMVTDGNPVLTEMFITSIGERRSADGTDVPRKNHRGYWCRVVIRISERPETLSEKRLVLDKVAAVRLALLFYDLQTTLLSNHLLVVVVVVVVVVLSTLLLRYYYSY